MVCQLPVLLTSEPVADLGVGSARSPQGPAWVYDGHGLGCEAQLPPVPLACPCCGAAMLFDLSALLRAPSLRALGQAAWLDALIVAFGLRVRGAGDFRAIVDSLGLTAHLIVAPCQHCAAEVASVWGYGEFQPGREVATYLGSASCRRSE